jgi:hypothetical protein
MNSLCSLKEKSGSLGDFQVKIFSQSTHSYHRVKEDWEREYRVLFREGHHRAPTHSPLPLRVAKTGKNHLNEEITPLLPTGKGERFSQTMSKLGHAALLRRCELF